MIGRRTDAGIQALIRLACALAVPVAGAATFSVTPLKIELDARHRAAILTLGNGGDEPLRVQVRSMHWQMGPDGQWQLTPSDDLIVTPQLIEVAPGQSGQLRIGSLLETGASEASYRLLIDELPNLSGGDSLQSPQIKMLTQVSLPVFLEPARVTRVPTINSATLEHGVVLAAIGNSGTQRLDPQNIKVTVSDSTGHVLDQTDQKTNYVLPGSTWFLHMKLSANDCQRAASISVSWPDAAKTSLPQPISAGAEACAGINSR